MQILQRPYTTTELNELASEFFVDMIKAVVDINKRIIAVNAELHADLESFLLEEGSYQQDLWGINIYPLAQGDSLVEFDSLINIRPSCGNRSRYIENAEIRTLIYSIVREYVVS